MIEVPARDRRGARVRRVVAWCAAVALVAFAVREADDGGWFDAPAVAVSDESAWAMLGDVTRWDAATSGERRGVAERVERTLNAESADATHRAWTLLRVRPFGFDDHRHEIAVYAHAPTGLEFSLIPGGTFTIGSPPGEADRDDNETRCDVTLPHAFLLARTECTQAAYERVMGTNPAAFPHPERPVETVSWNDAQEFCTRTELRLPNEAEWEFACRAGTTTRFWPGDAESDLRRVGWFVGNSGPSDSSLRRALDWIGSAAPDPESRSVGSKPANPYGLHDVHGNVREWCADRSELPAGPVTEPIRPAAASGRVFRGGGWSYAARLARSASRGTAAPGFRGDGLGFRPARTVTPE